MAGRALSVLSVSILGLTAVAMGGRKFGVPFLGGKETNKKLEFRVGESALIKPSNPLNSHIEASDEQFFGFVGTDPVIEKKRASCNLPKNLRITILGIQGENARIQVFQTWGKAECESGSMPLVPLSELGHLPTPPPVEDGKKKTSKL